MCATTLRTILLFASSTLSFALKVHTDKGTVTGGVEDGRGVFHGVPFAKPPVGGLRYMPPVEAEPWEGVRGGNRPVCVQPGSEGTGGPKGWETIHVEGSSEDCLYLSVYAPLRDNTMLFTASQKNPVLVYFHAGEFLYGSSNDDETNFPWFSPDVVLVTPNSRLGIFGYAAHPLLASRNPRNTTGNYGMLDQQLALHWVQKNIHKFGGDATRVTILGESSGGTSVAYHLTNPNSWGLFHHAIAQSPGLYQTQTLPNAVENTEFLATQLAFTTPQNAKSCKATGWRRFKGMTVDTEDVAEINVGTEEEAVSRCRKHPKCRGVGKSDDGWALYKIGYPMSQSDSDDDELILKWISEESTVTCLMAADPLTIMNISGYAFPHADDFWTDQFCPVIDGIELTASVPELFAAKKIAPNTTTIMGSNLDEATMMMYHVPEITCDAKYSDFVEWGDDFYGDSHGRTIAESYSKIRLPIPQCEDPSQGVGDWRAAAIRVAGDDAILCPLKLALSSIASTTSTKGYHYYFTHTPVSSGNYDDTRPMGSFHGAEIPFVFGYPKGITTDDEGKLHERMKLFWTNFITSGDPNIGLEVESQWPQFAVESQYCMVLNTGGLVVEQFVQSAQCNVFAEIHGTALLPSSPPVPSPCPEEDNHHTHVSTQTKLTPFNIIAITALTSTFMFILHKVVRRASPAASPRRNVASPLPPV